MGHKLNCMNNAANVIVNILVNSQTATAGLQGFNNIMLQIQVGARQAATNAANSFQSIFGANFFANLASNMVQAMSAGFRSLISDAINTASKFESAFKGVGSIAKNVGLSANDTIETVKNLDLVKSGLLTVGDAATATKNLLATGFSLPQAIDLIKRFGDTAAFGRQAALTFGYAISSATEGIKNQNSILVDNAGVTKNLSVILKERGFEIQDLSDKVKGAAAREALYAGLIKETSLQVGDSNKLLDTTQGALVRVDSAYQRFLASLGETITQSAIVKGSLSAVVTVLDFMGKNTGAVVALTASFGVLATAIALTTTNFSALTFAQITNAAASTNFVKLIQTAILVLSDFRYATALTAGEVAILSGGMLAIVGIIGAAAYAIYSYSTAQKETVKVTQESIAVLTQQETVLTQQAETLKNAQSNTGLLGNSQADLTAIYNSLNAESKTRVDILSVEIGKTAALTQEVNNLKAARNDELQILGRTTTADLVNKIGEINNLEKQKTDTINRINELKRQQNELTSGDPNRFISTVVGTQGAVYTRTARDEATNIGNEISNLERKVGDFRNQLTPLNQDAQEFAQKQQTIAKSLGITTDELTNQSVTFGTVKGSVADAQSQINGFIGTQTAVANATAATTDVIQGQIDAYNQLTDLLARSPARQKIIKDFANQTAEGLTVLGVKDAKAAKVYASNLIALNPDLKTVIDTEKNYQNVLKGVDELTKTKPERTRKQKSEYQSLSDSVKKATADVQSFTNLSSREFKIRFQKEELERVKKDFEQILDLRRELGITLTNPLPVSAGGARAEVAQLERVKSLRDEVLKVYREIQDGEDKLVLARITASASVVDAQTRADTAYLNGLRDRRNAEEQLTADIAGELRKRSDAATDSARNIEDAQATAYKEFLSDLSTKDSERLKQIARIQLLSGEIFAGNKVINAGAAIANGARPETSPVIGRLDKSNELLKQILDAVKVSQLGGSTEAIATFGNLTAKNSQGAAIIKAAGMLGINPRDLAAIIGYETSGTFSPSKRGGAGNDYLGLIQFGAFERSKYKITGRETFEEQIFKGVVPFIRDRFKNVGRSTEGATVLDLYKTINGGNPNVSSNASDGFKIVNGKKVRNTIAGHVERIKREFFPVVMKRFFNLVDETAAVTPTAPQTITPVVPNPQDGGGVGGAVTIPIAGRQRINPLASLLGDFFGLPDASQQSLESLSPQSLNGVSAYLDAQKEFNETTKEQVIATDRLNTARRVNFEQTRDLQIAEAQLDALLKGDSLSVREAITDAEISRNKSYAASLRTLVQTNDYLDKLRSNDTKAIGEIITSADAERATATAKAYQDIAKAKDFLAKYAAGDKTVLENLAKTREAARTTDAQNLTVEIDNLKAQAATGGRDAGLERLRTEKEYYSTIVAVGQTEAQIDQFRQLRADPTFVNATRQNDAISEQLSIERKLFNLENDRANAPVNQALRERLAVEQELTAIYLDEYNAAEDAAVARVRINDLGVFHEKRANAGVLEHISSMKSLTEIYTDSKVAIIDKVWSGLDTLFGKLTAKIPFVGSILKDILSSVTKLLINPFIMKLLGLDPTGTTGGGKSSGAIGTAAVAASNVFTGGGSGNFLNAFIPSAPTASSGGSFNPTSAAQYTNLLQAAAANGGGGSLTPTQLQAVLGTQGLEGIGGASASASGVSGAAQNVGGSFLSQLFGGGKFDFKGLGKTVGGIAPILGAGLGASLGGSSITGQLVGSAGGILAGGVLSSLLAGSLTGATTGGIFGTVGGVLGISAGATAGIALAIAPLLLLGSYFLGRSKRRRQEEKQRTQILTDAKKQLTDILNQTRAGQLDSVSALSQANAIREQYLQQVGQLKDSKTRNIAIQTVRELDSIIEQIKVAGRASDFAAAQDDAFVPTFAGAGVRDYVSASPSVWRRSANDTHLAILNPETEAVLNRQDIYNLGGYKAMSRAGVKGASLYTGNTVRTEQAYSNRSTSSGGASGEKPIYNVIVFGEDEKDKLIAKSSGRAILRVIKPLIYSGQDDGFTDTIEGKIAGEF